MSVLFFIINHSIEYYRSNFTEFENKLKLFYNYNIKKKSKEEIQRDKSFHFDNFSIIIRTQNIISLPDMFTYI